MGSKSIDILFVYMAVRYKISHAALERVQCGPRTSGKMKISLKIKTFVTFLMLHARPFWSLMRRNPSQSEFETSVLN